MRTLISTLAFALLLAAAAGTLYSIEQVPREDPLGRKLLYMPTSTFLEYSSLGNNGLMADFLYLWSIQYYSQFKPNTQFLYLDQVFDLITDLDPQYRDAYRVGAIIMLIEAEGDTEERKKSVLKLLDKGIRNLPDDSTLAGEAAWHCYISFQDRELAAHYAKIASSRPNTTHWARRMYGHLAEEGGQFTIDQAIAYWQEALASADSPYQEAVSKDKLYDLYARKHKEILEPFLTAYKERFGKCPERWQQVIDTGIIVNGRRMTGLVLDYAGNPYEIDPETCTVVARKRLKEN